MTAAYSFVRPMIVGIASLGLALSIIGAASAHSSSVPNDVVVVSSTELGNGSFTMTASNVGDLAIDLDLAAPGDVTGVSVDLGSFDGRWAIHGLSSGATANMTGRLEQ